MRMNLYCALKKERVELTLNHSMNEGRKKHWENDEFKTFLTYSTSCESERENSRKALPREERLSGQSKSSSLS